jgi:hypothetical protein
MKALNLILAGTLITGLISCGGDPKENENENEQEYIDPSSSLNTNFDGKIFSIPSPVQTAMLIKKSSATFYKDFLNPTTKVTKYNSEYAQALNLGIYGTDLGYASLYDQKAISLNYLATIEKLTGELGLEGAFDKSFMSRYENNVANQDSMMIVVSDAFKKADLFLKNGNRKSTSSLILTGGWIESMHLACELNKKALNKEIVERIGEQKQTLLTIIEILKEYNKMGSNDDLIAQMTDLNTSFDKVVMDYEFIEPQTNSASKTTTLMHNITITIDPATLTEITSKIAAIRNSIIL